MTQIQENKLPEWWIETTLEDVVLSANTWLDAIKRAPIVNENTWIRCFRIQDASQSKKYDNWGFTKVDDNNYNRFQLLKWDILIARTWNTVWVNYLVKEDIKSVFNNWLIRLRVNNKIDYRFLYNIISSDVFSRHIQSIAYWTSTQPNIQIQSLLNFTFKLPPLPEQQAIAKILSSFDLKIELLREQNETLEKIWQELFKEWFGKYKVWDELPEWWRVGKLGEVANEIIRGFTTNYVEKSNLINLNQKVNKWNILEKQYFKYYPEDTKVPENKFVKKYDILLNSLGEWTLWRVHFYKENTNNIVADQHISILRFNKDLSFYVYQVLCSNDWSFRLLNWISGSTWMLMLNINMVRNFDIIIPNKDLIVKYSNVMDSIYEKISINNQNIDSLSKTRDELLPKLMKGEVRVV